MEDFGNQPELADAIANHAPVKPDYYRGFHGPLALGPDYALVHPVFFSQNHIYLPVQSSDTVMVCLGGSDVQNLTTRVVSWILEGSPYRVHAVVGPFFMHSEPLDKLSNAYPERLHIQRGLTQPELSSAMKQSMLGVFSASNTLVEALVSGLPSICGFYTKNQKALYHGFTQMEVCWGCGNFDETSFLKVLSKLNPEEIALKRNRLRQIFDGMQAVRWTNFLNSLVKQSEYRLRYAEPGDCELYYKWANDPVVRKNAFSEDQIGYEEHVNWFSKKMKSDNAHLFVMEGPAGPVGQIRFDLIEGFWWIDYAIAATCRGQSLGRILLLQGLKALNHLHPAARVKARVKASNVASLKAFEGIRATKFELCATTDSETYEISI
jgi:RimJ/RimL family protein N-acetyltransferase